MVTRILVLIVSFFLLSSCMTIDSRIDISLDKKSHSVVDMDMSRMVTLLSAFGTGTTDQSLDKDLCKDKNFKQGFEEGIGESGEDLINMTCKSTGDYKVRIEGDMNLANKKGILFLSGVVVADLVTFGESDRTPLSSDSFDTDGPSPEDLGFSMEQSYTFPGKISYAERGTLSGSNMIQLNLLDPKVLKSRSIIVIVTEDGRKLSGKEINSYKLQLRKHNRKTL